MTQQLKCLRCNYCTNKISNIRAHLTRKDICVATHQDICIEDLRAKYGVQDVQHKCEHCDKIYSSVSGLLYHIKRCKSAPSVKEVLLNQIIAQKDEIIREMQDRLDRMKTLACPSTSIQNNTNNINDSVMVDNSIHVHINGFGNENTEYITRDFAVKCLEKGALGIMPMMEEIFFNEQHAENHNVRLRSLKNMLVEVFQHQANKEKLKTLGDGEEGSGKWVTQGFHDTVDRMIVKSSGEICKEACPVATINTNNIDDVSTNMNEIRNVPYTMQRRIKEKTKAKLVERQQVVCTT